MSIGEFGKHFGLSSAAMRAIADEVSAPNLVDERFQFDAEEFNKQVAYRSIELDSGGMLTAQTSEFDVVFRKEIVDAAEQRVRYSTEGRIVSEKLGKGK